MLIDYLTHGSVLLEDSPTDNFMHCEKKKYKKQ